MFSCYGRLCIVKTKAEQCSLVRVILHCRLLVIVSVSYG